MNRYALTADSPQVAQPPLIKIPLKAHQLAVIYRARQFEQGVVELEDGRLDSKIAVMSDKTGGGKSHELLGLIAHHPHLVPRARITVASASSYFNILRTVDPVRQNKPHTSANLLICPQALTSQWLEYLKQTTLTYLIIDKPAQLADLPHFDNFHVILLSSHVCKPFAKAIPGNLVWSRVIFDEADSINIPACPEFNACFWWFMTATPGMLMVKVNNNGFIRNVFMNASLSITNCFLKSNDVFVQQSFQLPEPIITILRCKAPGFIRMLNGLVNPEVQQALAAGDVGAAVRGLGVDVIDSNEHIVSLFTRALNDQIKEAKAEVVYGEQGRYNSAVYKAKMLEELNAGVKALEQKLVLLQERLNGQLEDKEPCYICFEEPVAPTYAKCCKKATCFECITTYLLSKGGKCKCPHCRSEMTKADLVTIQKPVESVGVGMGVSASSSSSSNAKPVELLTKLQTLEKWLKTTIRLDSRILFFSEYDGSFPEVIELLRKLGISYGVLGGGRSSVIQQEIASFKRGDIQVLLTNSFEHGAGHNFESASDVVIYHKMGKSREAQGIGRSQRPGRNGVLKVTKLYYEEE